MNSALSHLHAAGWVHRDPSPGNIIVIGKTAKLSDLEFATKRPLKDLEELTRPKDPSSSGPKEMRRVSLRWGSADRRLWLINLQGTPDFVATEVEWASYLFRRPTPLEESGTDDEEMDETNRIWLHNPLHDYESIWRIAVWFLFTSKLEGVDENDMRQAHSTVFQDRPIIFAFGKFRNTRRLLPEILHPIWWALELMRRKLIRAYLAFEKSFNGSEIEGLYMGLAPYLAKAMLRAGELNAKPNVLSTKLEGAEVEFEMDI